MIKTNPYVNQVNRNPLRTKREIRKDFLFDAGKIVGGLTLAVTLFISAFYGLDTFYTKRLEESLQRNRCKWVQMPASKNVVKKDYTKAAEEVIANTPEGDLVRTIKADEFGNYIALRNNFRELKTGELYWTFECEGCK